MSIGSIYKIVFPNGKHYIGLTMCSLEKRKREHKCCAKNGDTRVLYNALRCYEIADTFELVEIDTADTLEELCEKEIGYILSYNSYYMDGNGYNMTLGGDGNHGYVFTEDDKEKMSEAYHKYHKEHPEAKNERGEKIAKYWKENPESLKDFGERKKQYHRDHPEQGEKHSERMKKLHIDNPELGKQQGERLKLMYIDNPELRQKTSEAQKNRFENPEERQKISEARKKHFAENPEAREKCRERMKKKLENPQEREKASERMKKHFAENPEARKKYGETMKKRFAEHPEHKTKILDARGKNKPFDIFKIDGTFVKTFNYQFEATEYLQKEHNITSLIKVGEVLRGNRKSSAGFVFKYQE